MSFIFRAAFWFAVVGAFMPRDVAAEGAPMLPMSERAAPAIDAGAAVADLCRSKEAVCEAGEEIAGMAKFAGRLAAERAAEALADAS
jgi:hypothetical protein